MLIHFGCVSLGPEDAQNCDHFVSRDEIARFGLVGYYHPEVLKGLSNEGGKGGGERDGASIAALMLSMSSASCSLPVKSTLRPSLSARSRATLAKPSGEYRLEGAVAPGCISTQGCPVSSRS